MRPAGMLLGKSLAGNWKVVELVKRSPTATGGNFCTGYIVEKADGRRGFLKAMDYVAAFGHPNAPMVLKGLSDAYLFEKSVCEKCRSHDLRRVVHAIDSGYIQADPTQLISRVEYLIFELADSDVRAHLDAQAWFDTAFALRALHNVATGLEQLHRADMAHQDLKPSNVLVFDNGSGSKISDLGRAWSKELPAPHDPLPIAGDPGYAPPEALYKDIPQDVKLRRYGCDLYHLGSLTVFLFTRSQAMALLIKYLAPEHWPYSWSGSYADVLPYVQAAFAESLREFRGAVPASLADDLTEVVAHLCEPDPKKRGHPLNRQGHMNQFSLDRYISKFNLLAFRAERAMNGGTA
jgi:eukaryotic-like serine/threonine-protein kinase